MPDGTEMKKKVSNWGNYPKVEANAVEFTTPDELEVAVTQETPFIARGMGRCYGDSSLNEHIVSTLKFNKFIAFDTQKGRITCQAGVTLDEVLQVAVPKGFFLPVTPGTKFVTVGGAVASDIHGKNHHVDGSFSNHVIAIKVRLEGGMLMECSPTEHTDLFEATCGGMGLTGVIEEVTFSLKKIDTAYIAQRQLKARNLDELLEYFEKHKDATYSVAWVDCLARGNSFGRGILMLGEHAKATDLSVNQMKNRFLVHRKPGLNIPFQFPSFILNSLSIKLFNILYYAKNFKKEQKSVAHYEGFFYPLDNISHWNRMYGSRGFLQYQFVLPMDKLDVLRDIMLHIATRKKGSFLTVLKVFGEQEGLLSFPMKGYTLALDFPNSPGMKPFLEELDQKVLQAGGRIYLTKDARMSAETFTKSYKNLSRFQEIVKKYNSSQLFRSLQSDRLSILSDT